MPLAGNDPVAHFFRGSSAAEVVELEKLHSSGNFSGGLVPPERLGEVYQSQNSGVFQLTKEAIFSGMDPRWRSDSFFFKSAS